ncbi:hypothetical protein [Spirosoma linguale]|uniref:Uncharacterized protein n=1 Tax=Spirosoma linguale (strain ATCC 33905 / DSM 74 / LMG 10896 / Claus 1) TaxID=504472 RepID=D2QLI1_SPILD|nr:hypothetical protein Slin_3117 [Spirosoma linguale DSM 74]
MEEILQRVSLRTGIEPIYLADKWLLINPLSQEDIFSIYQEGNRKLILMNDGPMTSLLRATLYTLIEMGGYYAEWDVSSLES